MNSWRDLIRKWWPVVLPISIAVALLANLGDAYDTCVKIYDWLLDNFAPAAWVPATRGRAFYLISFVVAVLVVALLVAALERVVRGGLTAGTRAARRGHAGGAAEAARRNYSDYLEKDISNRLKSSIHFARFIDIGLQENFNAAAPWHYVAFGEEQRFENFDDAFEHYRRRVLLLGPPGSGKTTTLLNTALKLVREARQNPRAPLPLLFNLSTFDEPPRKALLPKFPLPRRKASAEARAEDAFERWLVGRLSGLVVEGLTRGVARNWVESGRVALLLDGLDEVNENRLKGLVALMNSTYFRAHPRQVVVVCSRVAEYQPLQNSPDTRLHLDGAVTLQPLGREQINAYLEAARATALRDALLNDEVLYEMAQTPLTLSMMTLAYGDEAPAEDDRALSFLQRRRQLLDTYVERMVQREARRRAGVFYDSNPDKDVPPRYPLRRTQHYLGWLAVKLSERMITLLPLARLHSFIGSPRTEPRAGLDIADAAQLLSVFLVALLMNVSLAGPHAGGDWKVVAAGAALAPLLLTLMRVSERAESFLLSHFSYAAIAFLCLAVVSAVYLGFCFGLVNRSLTSLLALPPGPTGVRELSDMNFPDLLARSPEQVVPGFVLATLLIIMLIASGSGARQKVSFVRALAWPAAPAAVLAALAYALTGSPRDALLGVAAGCVLGLFSSLRVKLFRDTNFLIYTLNFVVIAGPLIVFIPAANALAGRPSANKVAVVTSIAVGLLCVFREGTGAAVGVACAAVVGNLLGGPPLAVLAALAALLVFMFLLRSQAELAAERGLLNPTLRLMLALRGDICLRYKTFLDYAVDAMLLKRAGDEYEFVHRLLRDHFAIRELIPALETATGDERLSVIEKLSRQGESSYEALSNLVTHEDSRVRRAAVEGLSRTAAPATLPLLERTFREDPRADVRRAVVSSLRRFTSEQSNDLIKLAIEDPAPEVRRELVSALYENRFIFMPAASGMAAAVVGKALRDESEAVFRQALVVTANPLFDAYRFADFFRSGPAVLERLRGAARSDAPEVRRAALTMMGHTQDPACLADLADALRDRDADTRVAAVEGLRRLRLKEAVPPLLGAFKDKKITVREAAVAAVGYFGRAGLPPETEAAVIRLLREKVEARRWPSVTATRALGHFGGARAVEALQDAAGHSPNRQVRLAAIKALGEMRDASAVPLLLEALKDPYCRAAAAVALGWINDRSVIPTLLPWLDDGTPADLRIAACMALGKMKAAEALPQLRRLAAAPPDVPLSGLRAFLRPPPGDLRAYALVALGLLGDVGSLPLILSFTPAATKELVWAKTKALLTLPVSEAAKEFTEQFDGASPAHRQQLRQILVNIHQLHMYRRAADAGTFAERFLNEIGVGARERDAAAEQAEWAASIYKLYSKDEPFFSPDGGGT